MSQKTKKNKTTKQNIIHKDMLIKDIIEKYPYLGNILMLDYGLRCVGCFLSGHETLAEGARVHQIEGKYLDQLIDHLNNKITS